jgi:hypothetical protein
MEATIVVAEAHAGALEAAGSQVVALPTGLAAAECLDDQHVRGGRIKRTRLGRGPHSITKH